MAQTTEAAPKPLTYTMTTHFKAQRELHVLNWPKGGAEPPLTTSGHGTKAARASYASKQSNQKEPRESKRAPNIQVQFRPLP